MGNVRGKNKNILCNMPLVCLVRVISQTRLADVLMGASLFIA